MIKYRDNTFDKIRDFDCITLSFGYKEGGGFFTHLPISDKKYRDARLKRGRAMPDKVEVKVSSKTTDFIITDDWRGEEIVTIDNEHKQEIEYAIKKAREYGLLIET